MRILAVCLALTVPVAAQASPDDVKPTAWTEKALPLDAVDKVSMPPVDEAALKAEDEQEALKGEKSLRFAASLKVDLGPENAGTWERVDGERMLWRLRVHSARARSLNFGFDRYVMPPSGRLFIYSVDGKHVYRPFTADDNESHGQLWTPPVFGEETVIEVTVDESERAALQLHLGMVNHDYRGFGQPNMEKSGACNIDIVCPISDPYNDQERAVAVISTGGSRFCTGSLVNNTAGDAKPFFMTAAHCGITSGNAASLVTFWNYYNSVCRAQGPGQSPPGDGSLAQFNTGSFFRAAFAATDFTLVELDDAPSPQFNVFFAGWDRTPNPGQFTATVAIHHPNVEEMRITFAPGQTESGGWPPAVPGDGSHIHAIWGAGLGVTEPGSSGSPLYTAQGRYIGQLHGGPSACGASDLSDYYGRFSVSWVGGGTDATRVSNWLDPLNTGQITLDGRNGCVAPAAPAGVTAAATAPNVVQVTWSPVPGASSYNVYRAFGACPQTTYTLAANVPGTTFNDNTVSGGSTYAYVVRAVVSGCESLASACGGATATGNCTLLPTFAGLASATNAGTAACALNLGWSAGTANCAAASMKYNVYRSTTPGFVPGPANLRQSCVTGTTFTDSTVNGGTTYYYVVRGEDSTTSGSGPCNGGNQEPNMVQRAAAAFGPTSTTLTDTVESGATYWTTAGGTGSNVWSIVTTAANSPTHSWFVADPDVVTDQPLATIAAGTIPPAFTMSFFHRFNTETSSTPGTGFDGHVLEYSLDGSTWTDILAANGPIPANPARFIQNGYNVTISTSYQNPLSGRAAWSGDNGGFQEVRVNLADFANRAVSLRFRFGSDVSVADAGVWIDDITLRVPGACNAAESVAPVSLAVDGGGNGVFQPGETAVLAPTWSNTGVAPIALTGAASSFTGPSGPTYTIADAAASYGTIGVAASASCAAAGNCYAVSVTGARPATHWDGTILETVTPTSSTKTWRLHVGDSFTDVPASSPFYRFVETILHKGVTGGCTATTYCPGSSTTRDAMAVFVLTAKEPAGYAPPACGTTPMFSDVPVSSPFCRWIEELARRGVVSGCGGNSYCPDTPATREQMAVFVLRTLDPALNPPACTTPMFADVPASSPFCRWIEELARRGVIGGCGGGNYCPTAAVTRDAMAVFLTGTFSLTLYGL